MYILFCERKKAIRRCNRVPLRSHRTLCGEMKLGELTLCPVAALAAFALDLLLPCSCRMVLHSSLSTKP